MIRKTIIHSILFLICVFQVGNAQSINDQLAKDLQYTLDSMQQSLNIKGLGAAIQFSNDDVWSAGSGTSTNSPLDSITPDHAFAIASTTKTITAACILQLVDEGKLNLYDSLHHWLPSFDYVNPNITITQLLRHESGINDVLAHPNFQQQMLINTSRIWTFKEVIETFIQPSIFQAGSNWAYSNTNYLLLAMIIEKISEKSYSEAINNRFFIPLNLNSFAYPTVNPLPDKIAHLWLDLTGNGLVDDAHTFFTTWNSLFSSIGPAGGYFATPSDMSKWIKIAMNGSLYSENLWSTAKQSIPTSLPRETQYGMGLMKRNYLGIESYGHGGDVSYSSSTVYFPSLDISISIHANDASINSWALASTVESLLKAYLKYDVTVSNSNLDSEISIMVYPNPFKENITLSINTPNIKSDINFKLLDINGQLIRNFNYQINKEKKINIENLNQLNEGIYFLKIYNERKYLKTIKLIKTL